MPDREKVISNFEHEVFKANSEGWDFVDLSTEDAKEIFELLKKQEPVEPKVEPAIVPAFKVYSCGHCDTIFHLVRQKYCANCGRAVKWE